MSTRVVPFLLLTSWRGVILSVRYPDPDDFYFEIMDTFISYLTEIIFEHPILRL